MSELKPDASPWSRWSAGAAYAAESVARQAGGKLGFASPELKRLYHARKGFASPFGVGTVGGSFVPEEKRLIGVLLSKVAHRGCPARCSVELERAILRSAAELSLLDFAEDSRNGEYSFSLTARMGNLSDLLRCCLIPELLVSDEDCALLLQYYAGLCGEPGRAFLERLIGTLPDPRLALCVVPRRSLTPSGAGRGDAKAAAAEVDFAIEVPLFSGRGSLKLAIVIVDSASGAHQDGRGVDFDGHLQDDGWEIFRFPVEPMLSWGGKL
jgi:hypothetical protein